MQPLLILLQVLKFNAYYKQTVHESQNEFFRVRPVDIYYYLEDDSIAVIEPHVENSGMPQGQCHRVPSPCFYLYYGSLENNSITRRII